MIESYGQWILRKRFLIVISTLVLVVIAASGAQFLSFTNDYEVFFSEKNPQFIAFEKLEETYTKTSNIIIVLAPDDGQVFSRKTLEAVAWTTNEAWQIPYSVRVDSITNFQHTYADKDELFVGDLIVAPDTISDKDLAHAKETALNEPLLVNFLISEKAHVTGIHIVTHLPDKDHQSEVLEAVTYIRDLANRVRNRYPHLEVYLTGMVLLDNAFSEASQKDLKTLVPLSYIVILVLLWIFLWSFWGVAAVLVLVTLNILAAMGLAGWLGFQLNVASSAAPTIIITLAIADCVHFLENYFHEVRANGLNKQQAIVESLRINFQPIFLTSLTTTIGFLSMNFSDVPAFRDMGNIVAIGIGIAFVLATLFLPALISILPIKIKPQEAEKVYPLKSLADFIIRRRRKIFWGMAAFIIVLISFIPRNELNDIFVNYFDETFAFRQSTDFLIENLTGLQDIHYSLDSGQSYGISEPAYLQTIEDFAQWYRQQPHVLHVNIITDTFKRLNKNLHGDNPEYYSLPKERDLAAQYLLLYEMSLPYGLDLNNQINMDKSATRMNVILETISNNEILELEARAQQWLQDHGLPSMQAATGSGVAVMYANVGYRNIKAMLLASAIALVLISAILIFALRSVKYGIISLIPNLVPAAMAFGLWGLVNGEIGLGLSVGLGMTLGIVVDDTIHFMTKYLRAHREKALSSAEAVRYAFSTTGKAILITTVVLAVGFSVLSLSHFQMNADIGLITSITIIIALVVDFLFLPTLLMKTEEYST